VKLVPVTVTVVPPAIGPDVGSTPVDGRRRHVGEAPAVGGRAPTVVTLTPVGPAVPAGVVAVIWVSLTTLKEVAADVPKSTALAPVKLVPVTVTVVPPAIGPDVGSTPVMVGTAYATNWTAGM